MKIGFLLGSTKISGGTFVILRHANFLHEKGHHVYLIVKNQNNIIEDWDIFFKIGKFISFNDAKSIKFDIVIATWWESPYLLWHIESNQYAYFVQSIEGYFFSQQSISSQVVAHSSFLFDIPIITEATWIKNEIEKKYGKIVFLVRNGILKNRFKVDGPVIDKNKKGLRVLIEGPIDVPFKKVPETINAAIKSQANEIWLLTSSEINSYQGVSRVFSKVKNSMTPEIYRSCDLIIKQSTVEGMFGPPLEMFHCGGTAIVSNVTGHDEYIKHGFNALVNNVDDFSSVIDNINLLVYNKKLLQELKQNALTTAKEWNSWDEQSSLFEEVIFKIMEIEKISREKLCILSNHILEMKRIIDTSIANNFNKKCTSYIQPLRLSQHVEISNINKLNMNYKLKISSRTKKVLGIAISNEHIQELWHPIVHNLRYEYLYISLKEKYKFILNKRVDDTIDDSRFIKMNWIDDGDSLFEIIETFSPDIILFHNGMHPAYQKILGKIKKYDIKILYSELAWFPQKGNFYFDPVGTNGKSFLASLQYTNLTGKRIGSPLKKTLKNYNILVPLQLESDMNFLYNNLYFNSNFDFIRYIIDNVPQKYNIFIKPHPLDHNAHIYEIFNNNNVNIVYGDIQQYLRKCSQLITINSTTMFDAFDYDINIYKCGASILDNKQIAIEFNNKELILKNVFIDYFNDNKQEKIEVRNCLKRYQIDFIHNDKIENLTNNKSIEYLLH